MKSLLAIMMFAAASATTAFAHHELSAPRSVQPQAPAAIQKVSTGTGLIQQIDKERGVNVFASWCVPCRLEHPLLVDLRDKGIVAVHGLNYKDRPADAENWQKNRPRRMGQPGGGHGDPGLFGRFGAGSTRQALKRLIP